MGSFEGSGASLRPVETPQNSPEDPPEAGRAARFPAPGPLLVGALVVLAEAVVAVVIGVAELIHLHRDRWVMGASTAAFFVAFGIALMLAARGLALCRTWARGPSLFAQLITLGMAWSFRGGQTEGISVALTIPAAIGLVALLHPRSVAALAAPAEGGADETAP